MAHTLPQTLLPASHQTPKEMLDLLESVALSA